jgi:hypothetical protein
VRDELPNLLVLETLAGLRLPGENTILGYSFIEDMLSLFLSVSDKEDKIPVSLWEADNAL